MPPCAQGLFRSGLFIATVAFLFAIAGFVILIFQSASPFLAMAAALGSIAGAILMQALVRLIDKQ